MGGGWESRLGLVRVKGVAGGGVAGGGGRGGPEVPVNLPLLALFCHFK